MTDLSRKAAADSHDPDCLLSDKNHAGPHHVRPGHPKLKRHATLDRSALAYALSGHLCYTGVQPDDKAIDLFMQRYESYTPKREQQRQDDLADAFAEYEANR